MSIASAALGLSRQFKFQEQGETKFDFALHPLTYEDCARFSNWLMDRSRLEVRHIAALGMDPSAALRAHLENVSSGQYEPGGAAYERALRTEAGYRKVIELMIVGEEESRVQTSFEVLANDNAMKELQLLIEELNSNPLAARARKIPTASLGDAPSR